MVSLKEKDLERGKLIKAKASLDIKSEMKLNGNDVDDDSLKKKRILSQDSKVNGEPPKKKSKKQTTKPNSETTVVKKTKTKKKNANANNEVKVMKKKIKKKKETKKETLPIPVENETNFSSIHGNKTVIPVVNGIDSAKPTNTTDEASNSPEVLGQFSNFTISSDTIKRLKKKGVEYLFPIQIKTFDHIYNNKDVIGQARTGTGKTLAFAIPIVERLQRSDAALVYGRVPRVIVLAPTRELVVQINKDFKEICGDIVTLSVYGGTPYMPQERVLRSGVDIIVGTPGRVLDHVERGKLCLNTIQHVVLDEVDQMLDMGFADVVDEILNYAYKDRETQPQTLLFSATCPSWVQHTARKYMRPEETVHVDTIGSSIVRTSTTVKHLCIQCHFSELKTCIGDVVQFYSGKHGRALVFTDRKSQANELVHCNSLQAQNAQVLHGDIEQKQRESTLKAFRDGRVHCLVATNVAARGLDIPEVDLVVQTSPPQDIDSYIHRSGRTGRAGREGVSICFYESGSRRVALGKVERAAGIKFEQVGPPQPNDMVDSACKDAIRSIESVNKQLVKQFMESAKKVADATEGGALNALAAALADMSGATELNSRSLIDAKPNRQTWIFSSKSKIFSSTVFGALEVGLSPEIRNLITNLRLTTDEKAAVFDIADSWTDEITSTWKDTPYLTLKPATCLPPLKDVDRRRTFGGWSGTNYEGRDNFGDRSNNRYGGRRGRGGGGRRGGWNRRRGNYL